MSYTDLWRCRVCNTLPEILMRGKHFRVKCNGCNSEKIDVFGDSLDEVVAEWNRRNDPNHHTLKERISGWFGKKKS